jgi:membrane-associated phospholipid phosphatase
MEFAGSLNDTPSSLTSVEASIPIQRRVSPLYWLRPAEWVVVAFSSYLALRTLLAGSLVEDNAPRLDILSALMFAVLLGKIQSYRRTPWPEDSSFVVAHWMLFPFTLAPFVLETMDIAALPDWKGTWNNGGYLVEAVLVVHFVVQRFALVGLPLILLWLALGIHTKVNDGIHARQFAAETVRGMASTLRDWAPPVLLTLAYGMLGGVLAKTGIPDQDAHLAAIDRFFFLGHNPVWELQRIACRPVSEWMAFSYYAYAPLFPLTFGLLFAQKDQRGFHELALAITLGLALGFLGYTLVPAMGPAFTQTFQVSLDDYYFKWVKEQLMDRYRVPRDCFPSLHTCVSLIFLWAARKHLRPYFWCILPIVLSIPVACMYLRYHYFVDLLAGALLAYGVTRLTPPLLDRYARARAPAA